ncbi:hypothetical protein [Verrucomicrobium sp. 3C]|uniref:hypothetical protein n=1 Tax=Verrucomicrobium sp. 3C TaxID=1134055 RepID=UPI000381E178|nr:hypothetical protein [Verrucomicrobium sp. 3C]
MRANQVERCREPFRSATASTDRISREPLRILFDWAGGQHNPVKEAVEKLAEQGVIVGWTSLAR